MTVGQLIERLQRENPDHEVLIGLRNEVMPAQWASINEVGEVVSSASSPDELPGADLDGQVVITRVL